MGMGSYLSRLGKYGGVGQCDRETELRHARGSCVNKLIGKIGLPAPHARWSFPVGVRFLYLLLANFTLCSRSCGKNHFCLACEQDCFPTCWTISFGRTICGAYVKHWFCFLKSHSPVALLSSCICDGFFTKRESLLFFGCLDNRAFDSSRWHSRR